MAMDAALDATLSIGLSIELMIKKVVIRTAERLQKVRVLRQTSPMHMHVHWLACLNMVDLIQKLYWHSKTWGAVFWFVQNFRVIVKPK